MRLLNRPMSHFAIVFFAVAVNAVTCVSAQAETLDCDDLLRGLATFANNEEFSFEGLTPEGLKRIEVASEDLQYTERVTNAKFEAQETLLETDLLTVALGQNHLLLGGPGSGKTARVQYLFRPWTKQVSEDMSTMEFFGGQTESALQQGLYDINTSGSILEARYALIDEINNAPASLLTQLLSYLHPEERKIYVRKQEIIGKTRSIFSTGNATRPEILFNFWRRDLQSGPAMMNRFLFKSFVPNWLSDASKKRLDEMRKRVAHLKGVVRYGTRQQAQLAQELLNAMLPREIDVDAIDLLGRHVFQTDDTFEAVAREFANNLRLAFNSESIKSEVKVADKQRDLPYDPNTEWSERIRGVLLSAVTYSAALDLMRLPKDIRASLLSGPIKLSPLSLWRVMNMSITNGPGLTYFDPRRLEMKFGLTKSFEKNLRTDEFDAVLAPINIEREKSEARNAREALQWEDLDTEQTTFNKALRDTLRKWGKQQKYIEILGTIDEDQDVKDVSSDFEVRVFQSRWMRMANEMGRRNKSNAAKPKAR